MRLSSGEPAWRYDAQQDGAQGFHGNPAVIDNLVIVQSDGPAPTTYGFDRSKGTVAWRYDSGPLNLSFDILPVRPYVVVLASHGLVALDARTGGKVWEYSLTPAAFISPATDRGRVFAAASDGTLYAVDAVNGRLLWKVALRGRPSSSVAVADGALFVGTTETPWDDPWSTASPGKHMLYRVNPASGRIQARIALPAKPLGRPIRSRDAVVVYAGNTLMGLTDNLKKILWQQAAAHNSKTPRTQLLNDRTVLVPSDPKAIAAIRLDTGQVIWKESLPASVTTIQITGENLYVGIAGGTLVAYEIAATK